MKINNFKSKIRYQLFIIGYAFLFTSATIMTVAFFSAYIDPSKTVTIGINWMGEAHIEALVFVVLIPIIIFLGWETKTNILPKIKEGVLWKKNY